MPGGARHLGPGNARSASCLRHPLGRGGVTGGDAALTGLVLGGRGTQGVAARLRLAACPGLYYCGLAGLQTAGDGHGDLRRVLHCCGLSGLRTARAGARQGADSPSGPRAVFPLHLCSSVCICGSSFLSSLLSRPFACFAGMPADSCRFVASSPSSYLPSAFLCGSRLLSVDPSIRGRRSLRPNLASQAALRYDLPRMPLLHAGGFR